MEQDFSHGASYSVLLTDEELSTVLIALYRYGMELSLDKDRNQLHKLVLRLEEIAELPAIQSGGQS